MREAGPVSRPAGSESGIAYVATLFLLVILVTLGMVFVLKSATETAATMTRGANMQAHYLAESAANHALWRILNEPAWMPDPDTYYMHSLGEGRYGYKVRLHTNNTFATIAAIGAVGGNVVAQSYVVYVMGKDEETDIALYLSTAAAAQLDGLSFENEDAVLYEDGAAALFTDGSEIFTGDEDIDAFHILSGGSILFSTTSDAEIGGLSFADEDVVAYDADLGTASLYFDGSAVLADDEDIDAICVLDNGNLLLSTMDDASIGGLSFNDEDLVEYNPATGTATLYFDGSAVFTDDEDLDAVTVLYGGHIVLSTEDAAAIGSLSFGAGDMVDYDPVAGTAALVFSGNARFADPDENIDAAYIDEGGVKLVGFTEATAAPDGLTIELATPSQAAEGSLLIAAVAVDGAPGSISPPGGEGWMEVSTGASGAEVTLGVWWKIAAAGESASHTFAWPDVRGAYAWMMHFEGHDPAAPLNAVAEASGSGASPTSPGLTTSIDRALVLRLGAFDGDAFTVDMPGLPGHAPVTMDGDLPESAAVILAASADSVQSAASAAFSVAMPSPSPDGDLYIAQIVQEGGAGISGVPAGWTEIQSRRMASKVRMGTYYRMGNSEPASYTWEAADASAWLGTVYRMSTVDPTNPINVWADGSGNSAIPTGPTVTTTVDGALVLRMFGAEGDPASTDYWPAGTTAVWQNSIAGIVMGGAAMAEQPASGDTGPASFSLTANAKWVAATVAIAPGQAGPGVNVLGTSEAKAQTDSTELAVALPVGSEEGDLLIAAVSTDGDTSFSLSAPAGWNEIDVSDQASAVTLGAWWKAVEAWEPASHTFTWSGAEQAYGWMMRLTGHDPAGPIDAFGAYGESDANPQSPSVTTTVDNALLLRIGAFDNDSISTDVPGLAGHTAVTMDASGVSGGGIVFAGFTEAKLYSDGAALTIDTPSGAAEGDLLIAALVTDASETLSAPGGEGWTLIDQDDGSNAVTLGVWWKLAGASESSSHTFTWGSDEEAYGFIMRFTGHDVGSPVDAYAEDGGTNDATPPSPSVSTTVNNAMVLRIGGFDDDDVSTDDTGLTGHTTITMDASGSGNGSCSGGAAYVTQATPGASGSVNFDLTAGEQYHCITVAIAPAAVTGGGTVSGGAGYVMQSSAGTSGTSAFSLTSAEASRMLTIAVGPAAVRGAVAGGAGYAHQEAAGASGTSAFSLSAPEEARMVTLAIAPAAE